MPFQVNITLTPLYPSPSTKPSGSAPVTPDLRPDLCHYSDTGNLILLQLNTKTQLTCWNQHRRDLFRWLLLSDLWHTVVHLDVHDHHPPSSGCTVRCRCTVAQTNIATTSCITCECILLPIFLLPFTKLRWIRIYMSTCPDISPAQHFRQQL